MLIKSDIIKTVGLIHSNEIIGFLKRNAIEYDSKDRFYSLIKYLLNERLLIDKKIKCLYCEEEFYYYKDRIYENVRSYSQLYNIKYGFWFCKISHFRESKKVDINLETHNKNYEIYKNNYYPINILNIGNRLGKKDTFKVCPISGFKNDSRTINHYLKLKFGLNPLFLKEDIRKFYSKRYCKCCGNEVTNYRTDKYCDMCKKLSKYQKISKDRNLKKEKDLNKKLTKRHIIDSLFDKICPYCEKDCASMNISKHIFRCHGITIMEFLDKYFGVDNSCEVCGKKSTLIHRNILRLDYFRENEDIFLGYNAKENFSNYSKYCRKCYNKHPLIKFKKVYSFFNDNKVTKYDKIIEEIRRNYKNIFDYELMINEMLIFMRECCTFKKIRFKDEVIEVQGRNEFDIMTKIISINKNKITKIKTGWDINIDVYDFKYEYNNEICRYVPDFYFETANEKILIEVKSWFTLGFKRFENDYFNEDALLKALAKAESANNICIDNNFLFYMIVDGVIYNYSNFLNAVKQKRKEIEKERIITKES